MQYCDKYIFGFLIAVRIPPNYGKEYVTQFLAIFSNLKADNVTVVTNVLQNIDENPKLMQTDRVHQTLEAQIIILENVWPALQPLLK